MKLRGMDTKRMGTNKDIDFDAIVDHIEPIHAKVDILDYLDKWDESSACHKSQGGGGRRGGWFSWLPDFLQRRLRAKQGFTRVYPEPTANRVDETDLFDNVTLDEAIPEYA